MNCYVFRYVLKHTNIRTICSYVVETENFDKAYRRFKKEIKDGEITSVKIVNLKNFKKFGEFK